MAADLEARAIERRLSRAYVSVFCAVLVIFALAVHLAVRFDIDSSERAEAGSLLAQGRSAFEVRGGVERIDEDGPNLGDPRSDGVAWFDRAGIERAHEGFAPALPGVPMQDGSAGTTPGLRFATATTRQGFVRAFVGRAADAATIARADVALAFGFAIALVASALGGRLLARRAVVRIVQSMRTLRDFTADAAHEMRGPLAAIRSNAGASLRSDDPLTPEHRRHLQTIDATARAMSQTIDDLLLIARSGRPLERELFAVDLGGVVDEVVDLRRSRAVDRGLILSAALGSELRIYGNPAEIERIAGNLVDNAIEFTPNGGSIVATCAPERGGVALRVRDTGPGIDAADHERIFERFWRGDAARSEGKGTGLGLPIVRALVRRHGGDVTLRSAPGAGSEFCVWFPARPPEERIVDVAPAAESSTLSQP